MQVADNRKAASCICIFINRVKKLNLLHFTNFLLTKLKNFGIDNIDNNNMK